GSPTKRTSTVPTHSQGGNTMMRFRIAAALWAAVAVTSLATNAYAQTPKPGGHLNIMLREDLSQGFAVHETSTISTSYPSLPCFNNLVFFDQLKRTESLETLVPELAEKWSWQDNFRNLVFFRRKDEYVDYVKNPDYFIKGRPYLDTPRYVVIENRGTRVSALQAGKLDVSFPGETTKTASEQLKKAVPQLVVTPVGQTVSDNIIMNVKKPPFDNPKIRLAVSYAIDRRGLIQAVHQGGAVLGASLAPKPWGVWGIAEPGLQPLPGYGKPADMKDKARKL